MPKSTRTRSTRRAGRGRTATGTIETITRPTQSLPVQILLVIWRWRWELMVLVTAIYITIAHGAKIVGYIESNPAWLNAMLAVLVLGWIVSDNFVRRFVVNRVWCVITRHRVRACLVEMRTLNYSGNLPFIIACWSTKTGQVVWVWMRPGLSMEDLDNKSETIASACWARKANIERSRRNAALVRIEIDRRDPLSKQHITSPLLDDTSDLPEAVVADDAVMAFLTPDTDRVSDESTTQPPAKTGAGETRTKTSKTKYTATVDDRASVILGANGEDVSDYV
ncbi:hypothetical protein HPO96_28610 [Kribbella sandramycini]|uniref:Uncharacterized protein n=1 Tax=Kribbella sandramycini TaxID=60450 RepID=A0A7Y4L6I1_9ACTN|nr:hypothetical protein [Kribbella sandramycini]MBB6571570.1 hypothetical protein [Kribbella sandramycini]NOL44216.1 hypothetical protein [Kribbella sandramycini]